MGTGGPAYSHMGVQDGDPDVVQNGLALSATVHWLFDRHLMSLTDNVGLLVSHIRQRRYRRARRCEWSARCHSYKGCRGV
jgi:putative restriction endonuclease